MGARRLLPDTTNGVLAQVDEMLTEVLAPERPGAAVSLFGRARIRLLDAQPGAPSRPVGNGDPGGGRPAFTNAGEQASTSVVEAAALRVLERGAGWERAQLDRLDALPVELVAELTLLCIGGGWSPPAPAGPGVQSIAWCRWASRELIRRQVRPAMSSVRRVHTVAADLSDLVQRWSGRAEGQIADARRLAVDTSGLWCTSHLRIGAKEPRSERYPTLGLCRWCGDFHAGEGFLPTPVLLEARAAHRTVTVAMVEAERPRPKKRRKP
jgi:hypothetical protein